MRIYVGDRHRDARVQSHQLSHLRREITLLRANCHQGRIELGLDKVLQTRVKCAQIGLIRIALAFAPDGLVAGRTSISCFHTGQLPNHPVSRFQHPVGGGVNFGSLIQNLQRLRKEPLR